MGVVERSREVMAVMALHEALRNVCISSDWTYAVFWTIRPRPRLRGGLGGCKAGDEGSLMLMWEDGYCRPAGCCTADGGASAAAAQAENSSELLGIQRMHSSLSLGDDVEEEDPVRKAFRKMSIQLYNYGEGLMGKVASDKCHKWVFRESSETEVGPLNYWQSSFDSHPPEWMDQFSAGIQTIAVIQAGHGLLQLGSCKIVAEDLHFVLRMRYTFESLESQAGGGFLSQTFAPMRNRFFCGSPTGGPGGAANPQAAAGAWHNGAPPYFQQSSDFRLRIGPASTDPAIQMASDDNNITSLRLSLQNGSPASAAAAGSFDFRAGSEHEAFVGIKRSASASSLGAECADPGGSNRSNLLARRIQHASNKLVGEAGSFQELLQGGGASTFNSLNSPGAPHSQSSSVFLSSNLDQSLAVQIPPVLPNHSPMVSPNIKSARVMSPMVQPGSPLQPGSRLLKLSELTPKGPATNLDSTINTNNSSMSHPSTPKEGFPSMMNGSNGEACFTLVDHHPSTSLVEGGVKAVDHHPQLQVPTSAWESLKESLEIQKPPPTSGELYPDFMDSFFE